MATYRAKSLRVTGMAEIKKRLSSMSDVIQGPEIYKVMGDAVRPIQRQAQQNIAYLSISVRNSVNIAEKQPPSRPAKKTVLVVVHKKDTMREWIARAGNRSPRAKVAPGGRVAESLGTMLELGTTHGMKEHFWFRSALDSRKGEAVESMKTGFLNLIEQAGSGHIKP